MNRSRKEVIQRVREKLNLAGAEQEFFIRSKYEGFMRANREAEKLNYILGLLEKMSDEDFQKSEAKILILLTVSD